MTKYATPLGAAGFRLTLLVPANSTPGGRAVLGDKPGLSLWRVGPIALASFSVSRLIGTVTVMAGVGNQVEDFRRIVLRGRNVASFKFALAKSILTLAESGAT